MARSHSAVTNGGWPPPRNPAEPDPHGARPASAGQPPGQPGQAPGYPGQPGYADAQASPAPVYDPQLGYHYPQQPQPGQQNAGPVAGQGLSSLDSAAQAHAGYPAYGNTQPAYGQPQGYAPPPGGGHDPQAHAAPAYQPAAGVPYGAPPHQHEGMGAPSYGQWQSHAPQQEQRPYDLGGYLPTDAHPPVDPAQQHGDWGHSPHLRYGEAAPVSDEAYQSGQLGYDSGHGGALEQAYGHDEGADYEIDEPRRGGWALRIAGAVVVAIGLGYGLAQGYKLMTNSSPDGIPPLVKGDTGPAKTKPSEPGGKQFAHQDSKIMGRLGEGAPRQEGATSSISLASDADDAGGTRRVQTLTVGRDGSIASPPASEEPVESTGTVAVPGLTVVDGFGGGFPGVSPAPKAPQASSSQASEAKASKPEAARKPVVITPPKTEPKPVDVAAVAPPSTSTPPKKSAPAAKKAKPAATAKPSGANGYVAVLASVPASGGSRLTALKKFADMQQQYGAVLQNKTPDVREANLGERGVYHRLLVGPPGSRAQASSLCSDLKSAGYKDCWITAY